MPQGVHWAANILAYPTSIFVVLVGQEFLEEVLSKMSSHSLVESWLMGKPWITEVCLGNIQEAAMPLG